MKREQILLVFLLLGLPGFNGKTSFIYAAKTVNHDTIVIDSLFNTGYQIEIELPDSAIALYEKASVLAGQNNDFLRMGKAHNYIGIVYSDMALYEEALIHNQQAIDYFQQVDYHAGIAATQINTGNIELYKGNYEQAVKLYYNGIDTYESIHDTVRLLTSFINIGTLFYNNDYLTEAENYYQRALNLAMEVANQTYLPDIYLNLANILRNEGDKVLYRQYLDSALVYAEKTDHVYTKFLAYNSLVEYYRDSEQLDSALVMADMALQNAKIYGNPYNLAEIYNRLGETNRQIEELDKAAYYFQLANDLAVKHDYKKIRANVLLNISELEAQNKNFKKGYVYLLDYTKLQNVLMAEDQQKALQELDRKYQLVKKDNQLKEQQLTITQNEREIKQKNTLIAIVAVLFVFITAIVVLLVVNLRNRRKLAQKEVQRLQSEKEKQVLKALMEGEEKERSRIARELHDGINGNLASLKLNMESGRADENMDLLDDTMTEVRNISHNLMTDAVYKFGLKESLKNYIAGFNNQQLQTTFQFMGDEKIIHNELTVNIYRIVQELVKNCIEHAEASEILVQISTNENQVHITVEDDGKGFDKPAAFHPNNIKSGIGLDNVQKRIYFHQGQWDINASPGNGTSINIELPLIKQTT